MFVFLYIITVSLPMMSNNVQILLHNLDLNALMRAEFVKAMYIFCMPLFYITILIE